MEGSDNAEKGADRQAQGMPILVVRILFATPFRGTVQELHVIVGQTVESKDLMVRLTS